MKQLIRIFSVFAIIMILGFALFIALINENQYEERDIIKYNEKLHQVQQDLETGKGEKYAERKNDCHIIYEYEINDEELSKLYRNNALILDLYIDGVYVGKVAWDDNRTMYEKTKRGFAGAAIYLWCLIIVSVIILLIYFYKSFVKPVRELTKFSKDIAKGNLDEPLPLRKDNLFGSFVEAFDLMREELKESKKREIESELLRKEMVTDLGHDIKTPISVIKVACEVLEAKNNLKLEEIEKSGVEDIELKKEIEYTGEKIGTIHEKAELISSIMTNLMHTTLEDIDKLDVRTDEMDSRIITTLFTNLKNYGNIIIENDIPECLVYLDRLKMEQVVDNIIGNSHKYAGTDIKVKFSETSTLSGDGTQKIDFVKITVRDFGKGVAEDDLPMISQKYYRGKNADKSNGYGLGLFLVKKYMEKMGGGFEYYNDHGFVVELLVKKV